MNSRHHFCLTLVPVLCALASILALLPAASSAGEASKLTKTLKRVAITVDGLDLFPPGGTPVRCGLPLEKG